jgi:hypothetical protein
VVESDGESLAKQLAVWPMTRHGVSEVLKLQLRDCQFLTMRRQFILLNDKLLHLTCLPHDTFNLPAFAAFLTFSRQIDVDCSVGIVTTCGVSLPFKDAALPGIAFRLTENRPASCSMLTAGVCPQSKARMSASPTTDSQSNSDVTTRATTPPLLCFYSF